jgi:hypothetical protein
MEGVEDLLYYGPTLMVYYHYRKYGFIRRSKLMNEVFIYAIGVERVRVEHVANLCITHSGMMHLR